MLELFYPKLGLFLNPREGDAVGWCVAMLLKPVTNFLSPWCSLARLGARLSPLCRQRRLLRVSKLLFR